MKSLVRGVPVLLPALVLVTIAAAEDLTSTRDRLIVVYCRSGSRSANAHRTLETMGFANVVDFGGIINWEGEIDTSE